MLSDDEVMDSHKNVHLIKVSDKDTRNSINEHVNNSLRAIAQ